MENYRPKRPKWHAGGQHRPTVGVSTWDNETDAERIERHRRAYREIAVEEGWLRDFEAELNRVIAEGGFEVPF